MIHAAVFDAYGTLFDVHSIVRRADQLFPGRGMELSQLWRTRQLEYTWLRSLMARYEDFEAVTRAALRYACRALRLACDEAAEDSLLQAYRELQPYPEVPAALAALGDRPLAILSNGSPGMLDPLIAHAGLTHHFDAVLSVDRLRIYKPHPSVYQLAVDALGVSRERIAFVSSNFWDIAGATAFGFRTYWVNRGQAAADELGFQPYAVLAGVDGLVQALEGEG
jgi:2-haloacid dehalogenase